MHGIVRLTRHVRERPFGVLRIVISAGLLIYLLAFQVNLRQLWQVVCQARWGYLLLALVLMVAGTALRAVRWRVLLQALNITVPLWRLVHLYFVGAFFNVFLPTGLGGDAVRVAELARSTRRVPEVAGATLVDRATGLWVLFVLALLALPFSRGLLPPQWLAVIGIGALAGVLGGWMAMGTPLIPWLGRRVRLPAQDKLARFYRSVSQLGYATLTRACLISLAFDVLLIAFNVLVACCLGIKQPLGIFLLFTPIISFSLTLPISVGGLGVREQTYVLLFGALGVSAAAATAMSLLNYALTNLAVGLIGGIWYVVENMRSLKGDGRNEATGSQRRDLGCHPGL